MDQLPLSNYVDTKFLCGEVCLSDDATLFKLSALIPSHFPNRAVKFHRCCPSFNDFATKVCILGGSTFYFIYLEEGHISDNHKHNLNPHILV
jgi:hypothetical protein